MAEIVGTAGAVVNLVDALAKITSGVIELRKQWKDADVAVATFETQLVALKAALTKIREWTEANSEDPHYQLVMDLDHCVSHCALLVGTIDKELAALESSDDGRLDVGSRLRFLFKTKDMQDVQKMVEQVTGALTLLLVACNSVSLSEQRGFLERPFVRRAFRKVEEDSASLFVHRDADSLRSFFPGGTSIASSKRSLIFDFDSELLPSRIYRRVLRGSVRESLRKQGDLARWSAATLQSFTLRAAAKKGWTQLHIACQKGSEHAAARLIRDGADINAMNDRGWTPLTTSIYGRHEALARLLVGAGADIETKTLLGWTPLRMAVGLGHEAIVGLLLENGADPDARDDFGRTPLMVAAERAGHVQGHQAILSLLLKNGADVNAKADHGRTPLRIAILGGKEETVRLLLESGADADMREGDGGRRALRIAAKFGYKGILRLLLLEYGGNGAQVVAKGSDGWTTVLDAVGPDYEEIVRLTLDELLTEGYGRGPADSVPPTKETALLPGPVTLVSDGADGGMQQ